MDVHPNIEVHVFNPFRHRDSRLIDFAIDLGRVNHRMHNKIMVVDNAMAIVGGRNIGNHYFEVASDANFRDLDIAAAGPGPTIATSLGSSEVVYVKATVPSRATE